MVDVIKLFLRVFKWVTALSFTAMSLVLMLAVLALAVALAILNWATGLVLGRKTGKGFSFKTLAGELEKLFPL